MIKICRYADLASPFEGKIEYTEKCAILDFWVDKFHILNPVSISNDFCFVQAGDELVWKFLHVGKEDVYFPLDRLPKRLEDFFRENCHSIFALSQSRLSHFATAKSNEQ